MASTDISNTSDAKTGSQVGDKVEKSLLVLAERFLSSIKSSNGCVDLNKVSSTMTLRQKRRLYDIINVLEGVGLLRKTQHSLFKWTGWDLTQPAKVDPVLEAETRGTLEKMQKEIRQLEKDEAAVDTHIQWIRQTIRNVTAEAANQRSAYVTAKDVLSSFPERTVLAVQAPKGSSLEVPPPQKDGSALRYEVKLKSFDGPITAYVVNNPSCSVKGKRSSSFDDLNADSESKSTIVLAQSTSSNVSDTQERNGMGRDKRLKLDRDLATLDDLDPLTGSDPALIDALSSCSQLSDSTTPTNSQRAKFVEAQIEDSALGLVPLAPPAADEDFGFVLTNSEGIADLFDFT